MDPVPTQTSAPVQPVATPPVVAPTPPPNHSKLPWILLVVVLLVVMGAGGVFLGQYLSKPSVTPTPAPVAAVPTAVQTVDPTANWQTYTGEAFSLKYPEGVTVSTQTQGPSTTTTFLSIGPTQTASGRTQTDLFDGYRISVLVSPHASIPEPDELLNSAKKGQQVDMSGAPGQPCQSLPPAPTKLDAVSAIEYIVSGCSENVHVIIALQGSNSFQVTALYTDQKYRTLTDQILSTFKFTTKTDGISGLPVYPNATYVGQKEDNACISNGNCGMATIYTWSVPAGFTDVASWYAQDKGNTSWQCVGGVGSVENGTGSAVGTCKKGSLIYPFSANGNTTQTTITIAILK